MSLKKYRVISWSPPSPKSWKLHWRWRRQLLVGKWVWTHWLVMVLAVQLLLKCFTALTIPWSLIRKDKPEAEQDVPRAGGKTHICTLVCPQIEVRMISVSCSLKRWLKSGSGYFGMSSRPQRLIVSECFRSNSAHLGSSLRWLDCCWFRQGEFVATGSAKSAADSRRKAFAALYETLPPSLEDDRWNGCCVGPSFCAFGRLQEVYIQRGTQKISPKKSEKEPAPVKTVKALFPGLKGRSMKCRAQCDLKVSIRHGPAQAPQAAQPSMSRHRMGEVNVMHNSVVQKLNIEAAWIQGLRVAKSLRLCVSEISLSGVWLCLIHQFVPEWTFRVNSAGMHILQREGASQCFISFLSLPGIAISAFCLITLSIL